VSLDLKPLLNWARDHWRISYSVRFGGGKQNGNGKGAGVSGEAETSIQDPKAGGELIKEVATAKDETRGWRTIGFWITLIGTLSSTALALTGVIPGAGPARRDDGLTGGV
jgi:hypothetical protein